MNTMYEKMPLQVGFDTEALVADVTRMGSETLMRRLLVHLRNEEHFMVGGNDSEFEAGLFMHISREDASESYLQMMLLHEASAAFAAGKSSDMCMHEHMLS